MNDSERQRVDRLLDGDLSDTERARLLEELENNPETVAYLADRALLQTDLRRSLKRRKIQKWVLTPVVEAEQMPPDVIVPMRSRLWNRWLQRWPMIVAAVICMMLAMAGLWALERNEVWATVVDVSQGVEVMHRGASRSVQGGDVLRAGDAVRVSETGEARLVVRGLGAVMVGPEVHLRRVSPRVLELASGFIQIDAQKQPPDRPWRIRTPQAEAAVIGTQFNIASSEGRTALRVREGLVRLTDLQTGQAQAVGEGKRVFVSRDTPTVLGSSRSGSVLLLTSKAAPNADWDRFNQLIGDKLVGTRLWRLGFKVETKHYDEVQPGDLRDRALVIASVFASGVGEPALERLGLMSSSLPVLCLEPAAYPTLGLTLGNNGTDFGWSKGADAVELIDSKHILSAGLSGSINQWFMKTSGWGRPASSAKIVASISGHPEQAALFAYDTGATLLPGSHLVPTQAPARRVGLFLDPSAVTDASHVVWRVFESAVDWSVATGDVK